ncbi:unnamed protein product [marine sediment metagenome]|uniref:Glycosyltransferase 2-like domain-containing protein n=1 Tax=marine sediment metagenome TaxID=412755 RepID=X0WWL2_9ZZZZ
MRIHALTVIKDEEHRYLEKCLEWNAPIFDSIHVVDDGSEDRSVEIASRFGAVKTDLKRSFVDNEGKFRQCAWKWWLDQLDPDPGDWLMSFDADEFIVGELPAALESYAGKSASFKIHEAWGLNPIVIRHDGWWGTGSNARIIKASEVLGGFAFPDRKLGSGSLPTGHMHASMLLGAEILHLGYAREEDRDEKFARYKGDPNHSGKHIASIKKKPVLSEWSGVVINVQ